MLQTLQVNMLSHSSQPSIYALQAKHTPSDRKYPFWQVLQTLSAHVSQPSYGHSTQVVKMFMSRSLSSFKKYPGAHLRQILESWQSLQAACVQFLQPF